jgi:hypothetical protein
MRVPDLHQPPNAAARDPPVSSALAGRARLDVGLTWNQTAGRSEATRREVRRMYISASLLVLIILIVLLVWMF